MAEADEAKAPSFWQFLREARALRELVAYELATPALRRLPKGDGHPVMVLPGFLAGDAMTRPLRRFLRRQNYMVLGWELGVNLGLRKGLLETMVTRLRRASDRHGRKISLVGWSLGGIYARELAKRAPDKVRLVITLGSPTCGNMRANNAWKLYEWLNDHRVDNVPIDTRLDEPPPVPTTAIYSPSDGIVAPATACSRPGPMVENIVVESSHMGLVCNPAVLRIIADRLAQPEGQWRPYKG